ncbi:putative holin-like toxin [Streptococcus marmotae]|nr:putative holin-like toxin [Streptococcus marmotae]
MYVSHEIQEKGAADLVVYEVLSLMIAFGGLIVAIMNSKNK